MKQPNKKQASKDMVFARGSEFQGSLAKLVSNTLNSGGISLSQVVGCLEAQKWKLLNFVEQLPDSELNTGNQNSMNYVG